MTEQIDHWDRLSAHPLDASILDPRDTRGNKNRYLAYVRNQTVLMVLERFRVESPVLDFGCGTGSLSVAIDASGRQLVGVDISASLLRRTPERDWKYGPLFVRYDGEHLPLGSGTVAGACTYVVLNHILDDTMLDRVLREINRVMRPGGVFVAVEQVRTRRTIDHDTWQSRRTRDEFRDQFIRAGFRLRSASVVRYGRFPTTPLIRAGLLPAAAFGVLRRLESGLGRLVGPVPWDYADACFVLEKEA